jgi:hypothetical protein
MLGIATTGAESGGTIIFLARMSVRRLILPCIFMTAAAGVIFAASLEALLIPVCVLPCVDTRALLGAGNWDDCTSVDESGRDDDWGVLGKLDVGALPDEESGKVLVRKRLLDWELVVVAEV